MTEATKNNIQVAKRTATVSFVTGTALFLLFWVFKIPNISSVVGILLAIGVCHLFFALVINTALLCKLLINILQDPKHTKIILKYIGLLLLNVPIAIGYGYCVINYSFPPKG